MSTTTLRPVERGYEHIQDVASDTWVIIHNIGTVAPVVDCYIDVLGEMTKIIPSEVTATDNVTVTISFSSPQVGTALVI